MMWKDSDIPSNMLHLLSISLVLLFSVCIFGLESGREMAGKAADWLQDHALQWIDAPPLNKVDTHHHYVPSFCAKGKPPSLLAS